MTPAHAVMYSADRIEQLVVAVPKGYPPMERFAVDLADRVSMVRLKATLAALPYVRFPKILTAANSRHLTTANSCLWIIDNCDEIASDITSLGPICRADLKQISNWAKSMIATSHKASSLLSSESLLTPSDLCTAVAAKNGCCKAHDTKRNLKEAFSDVVSSYSSREFSFDPRSGGVIFPSGARYPHLPKVELVGWLTNEWVRHRFEARTLEDLRSLSSDLLSAVTEDMNCDSRIS